MAMNSNALASAMKNAVATCPDGGAGAMKALGKSIEDYIIANCDATYSWVAMMTSKPYSPDPMTTFNAKIVASGQDFTCTPSNFAMFISSLATFFNGLQITAPDGFSVSPLKSGAGTFTADQLGSFEDPTDAESAITGAFKKIADGIISGITSYFLPAGSGSHSQFTGGATLVSVA